MSDLMSMLRTLTAILLAVVAPASGLAQGPLAITLEEATARAVQNSHRLGELRARAEGAAAAEAGRRSADLPIVGLVGGYSRTNHVEEFTIAMPGQASRVLYPDVPDNYHARVDLQWPIYTAGRLAALERAAGGERAAAELDVEAARADARLEAARAFWALVTAGETEDVLAKALESTEAHVRDLRSRLDQGLIPPNEVLSAEAQLSRQRVLAIEARNLRGVAEADLRRVIGEDSRTPILPVVPPGEPAPIAPRSADPEALSQEARDLRPERRALASRVSAAQERQEAAAAAGLPQVSIGAGYDYARPNPRIFPRVDEWRDSWDVSVNVSWALWDGGRRKAEEAEAAAGGRALAARAAEFDRQLAFELEQRRLDADSAHAAIAAADDGVRAAVEARRVLGERFAAGVATSTEVLDADTAVLHARLDRTRAISAARLARARLDRAIGR